MSLISLERDSPLSITLFSVGGLVIAHLLTRPKRNLPPGPSGLPFIGNLLDLSTSYEWITFAKWADKWGPLTSASTLGTNIIVISTYKKAMEILDKKGLIYATRPHVTMAVDLMGWGAAAHFQPYGPTFKAHRKMFHEELNTTAGFKAWLPVEEEKSKKFVQMCLAKPELLSEHCFHEMASVLLRILYGYDAKDENDELVRKGQAGMRTFNLGCAPAAKYAVNVVPALKYVPWWFPGAQFKRLANKWRPIFFDMVLSPWNFVKEEIAADRAVESVISNRYKKTVSAEDEGSMLAVAASYFGAGSQNTAIVYQVFFLMMAIHPEIQKKAQEEMETVLAENRLPTLDDKERLPYLNAIIKEILRIHPPVPTGLPHANTEDDIVDGYLIPKGSIIMFNLWKMLRDPELYHDPETFNPDRFMGDSPEQDPGTMVFGFGRRVCSGRLVAEVSIFQTLATCVATLKIQPVLKDGQAVLPEYSPVGEPMNRLEPFKVDILPRFDEKTMSSLLEN